jgi:hypothetical protein
MTTPTLYPGVVEIQERDYLALVGGETLSVKKDFLAVPDAIKRADGVASGTALSSAGATFTAADTGKSIVIAGAGAAGVLYIGALTYVSAHAITLSPAVSTSVSAAKFIYGTNNSPYFQLGVSAFVDGTDGTLIVPRGKYLLISTIVLGARNITFQCNSCQIFCAEQFASATAATPAYYPVSPSDGCSFSMIGGGKDQSFIWYLPLTGRLFSFTHNNPIHIGSLTMIAWQDANTATMLYTFACYSVDLFNYKCLNFHGTWQADGDNDISGLNRGSWLSSVDSEIRNNRGFGLWFRHSIEINLMNNSISGVSPAIVAGVPQSDPAVSGIILDTDTSGAQLYDNSLLFGNLLVTHSQPGTGRFDLPPEFIFSFGTEGDTCGDAPIKLDDTLGIPDGNGRVARTMCFHGGWAAGSTYPGVPGIYIGGGDNISFHGVASRVNAYHGIWVKKGSNIRFNGCDSHTNNALSDAADGSGLCVESTAGNIFVDGGSYKDYAGAERTLKQRFGINLKAGYIGPFSVIGPDLTTNTGAQTTVTDGAISAGSSNFTSASSSFVARTHIGKPIVIQGAAPAGGPFITVIVGVTSPTVCVVAGAAALTVTAASTMYGSNKSGIMDNSSAGFKVISGCMVDPGEGMQQSVYGDFARTTTGGGNSYIDFNGDYPDTVTFNFGPTAAVCWDDAAQLQRYRLKGPTERFRIKPEASNNSLELQFRPGASGVNDVMLSSYRDVDTQIRYMLFHSGLMQWGDGATLGNTLTPGAAGTLNLTGIWNFATAISTLSGGTGANYASQTALINALVPLITALLPTTAGGTGGNYSSFANLSDTVMINGDYTGNGALVAQLNSILASISSINAALAGKVDTGSSTSSAGTPAHTHSV